MRDSRLYIALVLTFAFLQLPSLLSAQDIEGEEFAAAANLPKQNAKVEATLFVPSGVARISGLVVIVNFGPLSGHLYEDRAFRRMLQEARAAGILARLSNIKPPAGQEPIASQLRRNAAVGGADGLVEVLRLLADASQHGEVRNAPLLFWGFSAAASFGTTFAEMYPDRTIGFVRYHTQRRGLSQDVRPLAGIPALIVAGAKDVTAGVDDAKTFWQTARAAGAPWTFAIEPDGEHSSIEIHEQTAQALTIPWMAAVLRQRLSNGKTVSQVSNRTAWAGDIQGFAVRTYESAAAEKSALNWLPDEPSARGWQRVMNPPVRVQPVDPLSGTWMGFIASESLRNAPITMEVKLDGTAVSVTANLAGLVGETKRGTYDSKTGVLKFELDAEPAGAKGPMSHWTLQGVVFDGTVTGQVEAALQSRKETGRFLITRK